MGPLLLLALIYTVWLVRYPTWRWLGTAEQVFLMLILSYLAVLVLSIVFLMKDAKKRLPEVFEIHSYRTVVAGLFFAVLFQVVWILTSLCLGGRVDVLVFPYLKGYEGYAVTSILSAFALYLTFAVFGAFVEEVTFRAYIQTRIALRYGAVAGILVATLCFSLQHIHVFEASWIVTFLQTQFSYVLAFGIFIGYLFTKSRNDIWSVFAFHAVTNIFNVALPIQLTPVFPIVSQIVTILVFALLIFLLANASIRRALGIPPPSSVNRVRVSS